VLTNSIINIRQAHTFTANHFVNVDL